MALTSCSRVVRWYVRSTRTLPRQLFKTARYVLLSQRAVVRHKADITAVNKTTLGVKFAVGRTQT